MTCNDDINSNHIISNITLILFWIVMEPSHICQGSEDGGLPIDRVCFTNIRTCIDDCCRLFYISEYEGGSCMACCCCNYTGDACYASVTAANR